MVGAMGVRHADSLRYIAPFREVLAMLGGNPPVSQPVIPLENWNFDRPNKIYFGPADRNN